MCHIFQSYHLSICITVIFKALIFKSLIFEVIIFKALILKALISDALTFKFQIYFVKHNPNFLISVFGRRTWLIYGLKAHVHVNKFLRYSQWWSRWSYGSRSRENEGYSGGLGLRVGCRWEWSPVRLGTVEEE